MGTIVKKYMWLVNLVMVVGVSYFLAKMAALLISGYFFPDVSIPPQPPKSGVMALGESRQKELDIEAIIRRNFFDAEESVFSKDPDTTTTTSTTTSTQTNETVREQPKNLVAVKTSLAIELISTISVGDGRNKLSSCVISAERKPDVYTVHDDHSFSAKADIVRIMPKRVEFLNNGVLEYVDLVDFAKGMDPNAKPERSTLLDRRKRVVKDETTEPSGGDIQREGNTFTIPKTEVDKALANLPRLYTEIRAVPYFKNGKANGFKLINVKAASLFEKLGLRRGDVLKSINGTVLDIQSGLQTFNNLKNETSFTLEVERRGIEQSFSYQII